MDERGSEREGGMIKKRKEKKRKLSRKYDVFIQTNFAYK